MKPALKMQARTRRFRYGPGTIAETVRGTYAAYVSVGHGQCRRKVLKSIAEAKAWIVAAAAQYAPLTEVARADAQAARAILPDSVSLEEAARYWREHHPAAVAGMKAGEAWTRYAAAVERGAITLRPRTFQSYRAAWSRLGKDAALEAIDAGRIDAAAPTASPTARNGFLRALSAVFGYLVAEGLCAANPCAAMRRARVAKTVPAILAVDDVRRALDLAAREHPAAVPALALGLFAGLRPAEIERIRPKAICNGYIRLTPAETKTADARLVPLQRNLAAWLREYPIPKAGINRRALKEFRHDWRARGGEWPQDCARHSYASYRYELAKDAAATAAELGHAGTDVFWKHYRALAPAGSGTEYFAIAPKGKPNRR